MAVIPLSRRSTESTPPGKMVGWVWDGSGRGTISLITSCLGTVFLCTWIVIHPRVYKRESRATLHKVALFFKTILAPEFIAVEGLQEWAQCQRMTQECADFTGGEFKLIHAFYISMLALRYRTPKGDRVIWPNQYTWLLEQRLISWEDHANWGFRSMISVIRASFLVFYAVHDAGCIPSASLGTVLIAPFVDVATLVSTYRIAGTIPILSPIAPFSILFKTLRRFIRNKWLSRDSIAQYVRANEHNGEKYRIAIIHAEDDYDIPWHHSQLVFWHAVNASIPAGISYEELEDKKIDAKADLGAAGSMMQWKTDYGVIREEILKTGLHDVVMGYPVVTMAVMRFFEAADPSFTQ
ncbi:uncharacterized protein N7503_004116 [Penicillium pulvis]|uniref:uncharacterized protein n=1 Tax=Penicillium pulvis TaxID=1562058 RepID=UPI002548E4B8|nr:uncharacterized protein N7503_004116 [Penicillium pulvis]KAJ5806514.1 hypothetical protein N7503_004116 [Penicillium pulvis]